VVNWDEKVWLASPRGVDEGREATRIGQFKTGVMLIYKFLWGRLAY